MSADAHIESLGALPALALDHLQSSAYDYCCGGAGDEATVTRNVAMLDGFTLVPRMAGGPAGEHPLGIEVCGGHLRAPLLVSPMALQELYCPDAEVASAAAAADLGLGFCLSTLASRTPEEVAAGAGSGVRWFQLYPMREWTVTQSLVARAEATGFSAIVVTLDVPVVGRRSRDLRNRFDRFAVAPPAVTRDPAFADILRARGRSGPAAAAELLDEMFPNPAVSWPDVTRVAEQTSLPVLVKGVLHPDDVRLAVDAGARGVVVSNHGGRQFDRSISSVEALYAMRRHGIPDVPVFLDSGIRRGYHVAVALALGAQAAFVGRPVLWGLASGGRAGAARVLELFGDELAHVQAVLGAPSVEALRRLDLVAPPAVCSAPAPSAR
jgi:isopentenyl diphosphate isomerase/L-lactate dehydrogenase-like FMN-dependent dehydrogenase